MYQWGMADHSFRLIQDDLEVARATSKFREQALREINHYALVYGQDGPVKVQEQLGRRWHPLVARPLPFAPLPHPKD